MEPAGFRRHHAEESVLSAFGRKVEQSASNHALDGLRAYSGTIPDPFFSTPHIADDSLDEYALFGFAAGSSSEASLIEHAFNELIGDMTHDAELTFSVSRMDSDKVTDVVT